MGLQRVYRLVVEMQPVNDGKVRVGAPTGDSVLVRPVIPGAYVTPATQDLGPKASNNRVTFYVAPLARGKLPDARVEVCHQGRVLQEVRTPMKVTHQRLAWVLFFLSVVVFGLLAYKIKEPSAFPDMSTKNEDGRQPVRPWVEYAHDKVPNYDADLPESLREYFAREPAGRVVQDVYDWAYGIDRFGLYLAGGLLVLSLLAWFLHRPVRKRRRSQPMQLPLASGAEMAYGT